MSNKELIVLLGGVEVGRAFQSSHGRVRFVYADSWRTRENAYPLSLSMPLQSAEHGHSAFEAFVWGLLPDNAAVLERWAAKFHISARNPFALIAHVGEDCAGAVQFVQPERLNALKGSSRGAIEWLTVEDVAQRLRLLRTDHSAWRSPQDAGQFSLAGAQPKTALLFEDGRWGVPSGRVPTTHILKPPNAAFAGFAENEHFCLELARNLGLPAAASEVKHFSGEVAIVIERYDRVRTPAGWIRIHQEDICQALAIPPTKKYQNDGGPGVAAIVELLRSHSSAPAEDESTFIDAVALSWLTAATDAHAKNYSLLIAAQGHVRLAPLYDLASVLPYPQLDLKRVKLAMKVGGQYRLQNIGLRELRKLAVEVRKSPDEFVTRISHMAQAGQDLASDVARSAISQGLSRNIIDRLSARLISRFRHCLSKLQGS